MIDTLPVHHLSRVLSLLKKGDVLAFPTGTTYGFGVNALDTAALQKLTDLKGRSAEKAYSILLPDTGEETYVRLQEAEKTAYDTFMDRPLTLLVESTETLSHLAKDGRVGIRTADHPFTKELAKLLPFPITATSANVSGKPAAASVDDLLRQFSSATFMAVDGGTLPTKKPSTVASWKNGTWTILREGDVTAFELKHLFNKTS